MLVADLLGHSDLSTLKIYTQPNDEDRERALALLTHRRLTSPAPPGRPQERCFFAGNYGEAVSRDGLGRVLPLALRLPVNGQSNEGVESFRVSRSADVTPAPAPEWGAMYWSVSRVLMRAA